MTTMKICLLMALFALVFLFYLATMAPTVLWGDEAYLQRSAFEGTLSADGGGHWLWLRAARLFIHLPWGDVAYRVNLLSVVAACFTILLVYAIGLSQGLTATAATASALSLAVANTFWTFAVRAEVYALFMALLALQLWLWASWREGQSWPILLAALLFGLTLLGHQMGLLLLPALALLLWRQRGWLNRRQWIFFLLLFSAGLLPFLAVVHWQAGSDSLWTSLHLHLTHSSDDFSDALFDFSLSSLPRDAAVWVGLLGLQFVGLAGLLAPWGIVDTWRKGLPSPWSSWLVLYASGVLFAFSYHVNDQFVFYLPSYVAFALFVGRGWQAASESWGNARQAWLLALLLAVPIFTYAAAPRLLTALHVNPLGVRELPGREPHSFFLWPAKNGYQGAADYGRAVLQTLPPNSVLIADHTPAETVLYFQSVEGLRPDVRLVYIASGRDLAAKVARFSSKAHIFLADDNPDYYNLRSLPGATVEPVGIIYQLLLPQ